MTHHFDVIIIGGGIAGVSIAYHLARQQVKVLLLESRSIGAGTSGAAAGRAQVSESHRGRHMDVVLAGLDKLEHLQEELDCDFEWRRLGNLMLIEQENHWHHWSHQVDYLQRREVPAALLSVEEIRQAEPALVADRFLGAAWCLEGHLNPLKLVQAYASAARRFGATLKQYTPVLGIRRHHETITSVVTPDGDFSANTYLLTTGAWTGDLLHPLDVHLPVKYTHAEALITEAMPPLIHNHVGLADFYDTIHHADRAVSIGFAQQRNGTLLVTQAVTKVETMQRSNSAWSMPALAHDLLQLVPSLAASRVVRAWAAPSPFLPDERPAIGLIPGLSNGMVATCFHLTITTIPVLSEAIASLVVGGPCHVDLTEFDPSRFASNQGAR